MNMLCEGCGLQLTNKVVSPLTADMMCTVCTFYSDCELRVWDGINHLLTVPLTRAQLTDHITMCAAPHRWRTI